MIKKIIFILILIICLSIGLGTISAADVNDTVENLSPAGGLQSFVDNTISEEGSDDSLAENSTTDMLNSQTCEENIAMPETSNNSLTTSDSTSVLGETIGSYNVAFAFKNIANSNGYLYDFITYANNTNGDLGSFNVKYTLTMSDGSNMVLNKLTNDLISQTLTKPLYNIDVLVEGKYLQVTYPLNALQMIVDGANAGDTITLMQDYSRVDGVDKYSEIVDSSSYNANSHIIVNTRNIVINGNGHTLNAVNNGRLFEINSDNVKLYNMILKNTYVVGNNVHGGAVWWKGSNGKIDQLTITDSQSREESMSSWCYVSSRYAAGGSVYWQGVNGIINHTTFTNSHAAHSGGSVYWTGSNGIIDCCQFTGSKIQWAKGESVCSGIIEGSAIHWDGENGKFLNSKIQDSSVSPQGAYQGTVSKIVSAVYATKSSFYVDNITVTNTQSPGGNGYSLNISNPSGSNFGDNINIENKILTPTFSIISTSVASQYIVIVKDAKSGKITYTIDGANGGTGTVNHDGQALINAPALSTGRHTVNIQYQSDLTYVNDASGTITDFSRLYKELSFSSITLNNNVYKYDFVLKISDGLGNYDENTNVEYRILLTDGSVQTLTGLSNRTVSWSGSKPLYNLTAIVDGEETSPIVYPFKALQLIINAAAGGSTIYLSNDYTWVSDIDTCNAGAYFFSFTNKIVDGQGHTINGLSNIDTGANDHDWKLFNLGNNAVLRNVNIINFTYNRYGYINGGAVYVSGSKVKLINVNITRAKNSAFAYSIKSGHGGAIIWNGKDGLIDNCRIINCHGGQYGTVTILQDNVVINNSKIINSSVNNWHDGYIGAIAIRWDGNGGSLINTEITGSKILRNQRLDEDYEAVVAFTKKPKQIENITITPLDIGYSVTCYSLLVPYAPVEDYIGENVRLEGGFKKFSLISITLENDIFTVNPAKSGTVSYTVNGGETKTIQVDKNGHFTIDYAFNPQQNYIIKIVYNENTYYNSFTKYFDYHGGEGNAFGTFTDLNNLIQSSTSSIIELNQNYIYDPVKDAALSGGITISKTLTVNGNNYYIDADYNPVRIFTTTKNVILNNITFKNSRLNEAGNAVLAKAPVTINHCTFDNNWASNCFGAAVNLAGGNSHVQYCTFTNNKAKTGAGIVVNSMDNYIHHCLFEGNSKDYGGAMNYGSDISISGSNTAFVNYNAFLDPYPLRQISADYSKSNWYGSNSLPDLSLSGAPGISNYLTASLDYTLNGNVLTVGIKFSESDTGNAVDVLWARTVIYTVASKTIIGDNLNKVEFSDITSGFVITAVVDNQKLTSSTGSSWYVSTTGSSRGSGTQSNPYNSLQRAIRSASNGDTIYIAPGTYSGYNNAGLTISKSLTIERWGDSGEVIFDGQNNRNIFNLNANVIISSLTFKNAKSTDGGALSITAGNSVILNSIFKDNTVTGNGGAISISSGDATIINSQFTNNKATSGGGAINTAGVNLNIINSVFTNNNAGKAGAINSANTQATLNIIDSTFKDNAANTYGGALIFEGNGNITNSTFISNHAGIGGGAIYMWGYNHTIDDSKFINNNAAGGGAIISLFSNLDINKAYFKNNNASTSGGAVYVNYGTLVIYKGDFIDNNAYYDGGAVYVYESPATLYELLFKNNTAGYGGGAIHSLASDMYGVRLNMINNVSAESNGYISTLYLDSFIDYGDYTMVVADTSNYNGVLPSYYSLPDNGWDTPVKNQGNLGVCWDYAIIATVETAIKKATGIEVDLSENNVKNLISLYSIYGRQRDPNNGGWEWEALSYLANSLGPVFETTDPTSEYKYSMLLSNVFHIANIGLATRSRDNPLNNTEVKEALMKYGAVQAHITMDNNHNGKNYYHNTITAVDHAVAIVGWDDNYSKDNFPNNCPGDGAWIVKNSWGSSATDSGYIYVSYYDQSFGWNALYYIIFNDTVRYSRVYQYDYSMYNMKSTDASVSWYKNIYTSVKNEALTAFSTYFNEKTDWEVFIYVGDELKYNQSGTSQGSGYFTFNFDKVIPVIKGEEFTIELKVNNANIPYVAKNLNTLTCGEGVSYYSKDGTVWSDLNNDGQVACLKVFTQNVNGSQVIINSLTNAVYNNTVTVNYSVINLTTIVYTVKTKDGKVILDKISPDNTNQITLSNLAAGEYIITVTNEGNNHYARDSKSAYFNITKATNNIEVIVENKILPGNVTVKVKADVDGIYKVSIGSYQANVNVKSGEGTTTLSLPAGLNYNATTDFTDKQNYTVNVKKAVFNVTKGTNNVKIQISNVDYPANTVIKLTADIKETYTVDINGTKISMKVTKNKGTVSKTISLTPGNYFANITGYSNSDYEAKVTTSTFKVNPGTNTVTVQISDIKYNQQAEIHVTADVKGNYTLNINGTEMTVEVPDNGATGVKTTNKFTKVGKYYANVTSRMQYYTESLTNATFNVWKAINTIKVEVNAATYPENITVKVTADVDGEYIIDLSNGDKVAVNVKNGVGTKSVKLNAGDYTAGITYVNENYEGKVTNTSFTVLKGVNVITVNVEDVHYNQCALINVSASVDGVYTVKVNGSDVKVNVTNGKGSNTTPILNIVGKYYANAVFNDDNYDATINNATFNVVKAINNIKIEVNGVTYPENVTVKVTADVDGIYIVDLSNGDKVAVNVKNGVGTKSVKLNAGDYTANITYVNENYEGKVNNASFTVLKGVNVITVNVNDVYYNQCALINVSASVDGVYTVKVNGSDVKVTVTNGKGSNTTPILNIVGKYYANAVFNDDNYDATINNVLFNVWKAINNIKIEVNGVTYPENVTVKVTADVDGEYIIDLSNGGKIAVNVKNGVGTKSVKLNAGDYTANITYVNENYEGKVNNASFTVSKAVNIITVSVNDVYYNQCALINVSASVDGVYTVKVNGSDVKVTVTNGKGSGKTAVLTTVGKYYANAIFYEDNYDIRINNATFNVLKAINDIKVEVNGVTYPNNVTIKVTADIDGAYTVDLSNGEKIIVNVLNGHGTESIKLNAGDYTANITYVNENYEGKVNNASFTVSKAVNIITVSVNDVYYNQCALINVSASVDGVYTVKVNGSDVKVNVTNGKGSNCTAVLTAVGKYYAIAVFNDDNYDITINNDTFDVLKAINNIKVEVNSVNYPNNVTFNVTADVDGEYIVDLSNGDKVNVNVKNGVGIKSVKLNAGDYTANITYVNENYEGKMNNASFTVLKGVNVITVCVNDVYCNQSALINVSASVDGVYTVKVNGSDVKVNVTNGKGSNCTAVLTAVGKYYAIAVFNDDNYNTTINNATFNVFNPINNIKIEVNDTIYPNNITVKLTADIAGVYTVKLNGTELHINVDENKGTGFKSLNLTPGKYNASVIYTDINYEVNVSNTHFIVGNGTIESLYVTVESVNYPNMAYAVVCASVDGEYKVSVNNKSYVVFVKNGTGISDSFDKLNADNYEVNVSSNIRYYDVKSNRTTFDVFKAESTLNVNDIEFVYGTSGTSSISFEGALNITVSEIPGASITVNDNVLCISDLNAGEYKLNITTVTDSNHKNISKIISVKVIRADPGLTVIITNATYPENNVITVKSKVDGEYEVNINGTIHTVNVKDGCGNISVKMDAASYKAIVALNQTANYNTSVAYCEFKVTKSSNYAYIVTPDTVITHADSVTFYANAEDATGKVVFYDITIDKILNESEINTGFTVNLPAGEYQINASYEGDRNHEAKWSIIKLKVNKVSDNAINITFGEIIYGSYIKVNVTVSKYSDVNGTVLYYVNGQCIGNSSINNQAIIPNEFAAGTYNITVVYQSMDDYEFANVTREVIIHPADSSIDSDKVYVTYDMQPCSLKVSSQNATKITYHIYDADKNLKYNNTVNADERITLPNLNVGRYTIVLTTVTDTNHTPTFKEYDIIVANAFNNITVEVADTHYNHPAIINVAATVDGIYTVKINGTEISVNVTNGKGSNTTEILTKSGKYYANATFSNGNYTTIINNATFNVLKASNNIKVQVNSVMYPDNVTFKLTADIDGNYTVALNSDKEIIISVKDGEGTKSVKLNAGSYSANVTYASENYEGRLTNATFTVSKAKLQIGLITQNSTYGQKQVIGINVSVPGKYYIEINNIYNNTIILSQGINSLDIPLLNAGEYNLTVTAMIPNYEKTVASQLFLIDKAYADFDIKTNNIKEADDLIILILINQTGRINITINNETYHVDLSKTNNLTLLGLTAGEYTIKATYIEDMNYYSGNTIIRPVNITYCTAHDLQMEIDEAIKNNEDLNLTHNYVFIENESVVYIDSSLKINGNGHRIDANKKSSIFKITAKDVTLTNLTLANSNGSAVILDGDDSRINNVNFINNTANDGGAIRLNANNAVIGDCEFINNTASQNGGALFIIKDNAKITNANFRNNNARRGAAIYIVNSTADITQSSFMGNELVDHISAITVGDNVTITVDENTKNYSDVLFDLKNPEIRLDSINENTSSVEIRVNLSANDGNVTATVNNKNYTSEVKNGSAVIKITDLESGKYSNVSLSYKGPDYYDESQINISFTIPANETLNVLKITDNKNVNAFYLENKPFTVKIIDNTGKALSGENVRFNVNGKVFTTKTDNNGFAALMITFAPGKYTVKTSVDGYNVTNTITVNHIVSTKKISKIKKSSRKTVIKITVKGHNVKQNVKVKFTYTGKNKVKVRFAKMMKNQKVTVKFKGKTYSVKVNKKAIGKLKLSKKVAKKLKKGKKYSVKVTYMGPKLYKKVKLTVKFKGKKYKVKTNVKGIAKFKVTKKMVKKFKKGKKVKYTITYKKDKIIRYVKIR